MSKHYVKKLSIYDQKSCRKICISKSDDTRSWFSWTYETSSPTWLEIIKPPTTPLIFWRNIPFVHGNANFGKSRLTFVVYVACGANAACTRARIYEHCILRDSFYSRACLLTDPGAYLIPCKVNEVNLRSSRLLYWKRTRYTHGRMHSSTLVLSDFRWVQVIRRWRPRATVSSNYDLHGCKVAEETRERWRAFSFCNWITCGWSFVHLCRWRHSAF